MMVLCVLFLTELITFYCFLDIHHIKSHSNSHAIIGGLAFLDRVERLVRSSDFAVRHERITSEHQYRRS